MKWGIFLILAAIPAWAANDPADTAAQPSRIDRRPGILEPPSDVPAGPNAHFYLDEALFDTPALETALEADQAQDD